MGRDDGVVLCNTYTWVEMMGWCYVILNLGRGDGLVLYNNFTCLEVRGWWYVMVTPE